MAWADVPMLPSDDREGACPAQRPQPPSKQTWQRQAKRSPMGMWAVPAECAPSSIQAASTTAAKEIAEMFSV